MAESKKAKVADDGAIALQPPDTKQGGRKTSNHCKSAERIGFWCGIDYLTLSHPKHFHPAELCATMGEIFKNTGEAVTGDHGYRGYEICAGYGKLLQRPCRDCGDGDVLVRLPGRALDWIRDNNVLSDSESQCTDADICRLFVELSFRCTRIDIAMDANDPAVTPEVVEALIVANSYVCRARRVGLNDSWDADNPKSRGEEETVYLGSRISTRYFRCYNKAADIFRRTGRKQGHLTRFELEMKGDAAQKTMALVSDNGNHCIPRLFAGWVDFKDPNDDASRVERRRSVDWWERLVRGEEPVSLGLERGVSTPEQSLRWVKDQVAKTLFLAHRHGLFGEVIEAINKTKHKVKPSENEILRRNKNVKNVDRLIRRTFVTCSFDGSTNGFALRATPPIREFAERLDGILIDTITDHDGGIDCDGTPHDGFSRSQHFIIESLFRLMSRVMS